MRQTLHCTLLSLTMLLPTLAEAHHINDPHSTTLSNTRFAAYASAPKTLDPAKAYTQIAAVYIGSIYEPLLQIHYLDRPYRLVPLTAKHMPKLSYFDKHMHAIKENDPHIAYTQYTITLQSNIHYQPHWAFNPKASIETIKTKKQSTQPTRTLTTNDYIYEMKRLASPKVNSPIYGIMKHYIVGLSELHDTLLKAQKKHPHQWLDLRNYPLKGVKAKSDAELTILIRGNYPPFIYWLSMPFFSPIPWEADKLYAQAEMASNNISFDWTPIGTGPYYLKENNPHSRIVLAKNPNFHNEYYPTHGESGDKEKGYLKNAGEKLPFIDQAVYQFEKESIPTWNKFLQGYYDISGVSANSFYQAIQINPDGNTALSPELQKKGMSLKKTVDPIFLFFGFNMLDPIVGGYSDKQRYLRQAISIAINYEDYIAIFLNGRGVPAQSVIPPGIFGYSDDKSGMNPFVYEWVNHHAQRKPIATAKQLLAKAGYPHGINPKTHHHLILHYDVTGTGSPVDKAYYVWLRKQFAKLGIQLDVRATLYNRFQDKIHTGQVQLFSLGWTADYPDPENFLFLLSSKNGTVSHGGENTTNYSNPAFDALFNKIILAKNGPKRLALIRKANAILNQDAPMAYGYYPISYTLSQQWNGVNKPNSIAYNTLKYQHINVAQRKKAIQAWNTPLMWPICFVLGLLILTIISLYRLYKNRDRKPAINKHSEENS